MCWKRLLAIFISLLLVSCGNEANSIVQDNTSSPTPQGPLVVSANSRVKVKAWEYISPTDENALTRFPSSDSEAIKFGEEPFTGYVLWRDTGFDLIWGGFICSTEPVLVIEATTIELWPNDLIWDDCEAMEAIHQFSVEIETDIPNQEWAFVLHPGQDPPPQASAIIAFPQRENVVGTTVEREDGVVEMTVCMLALSRG